MSTKCSPDNKYEYLNCDLQDFKGKSFTRPAPKCCTVNESHCSTGQDGTYTSCKPEAFTCEPSYADECGTKSRVWYAQPSSTPDNPAKTVVAYLPTEESIYNPVNNLTCCPGNYVYKLGPWKA